MNRIIIVILILPFIIFGCGKKNTGTRIPETSPVSAKIYNTPPGADPTVPAELGGAGFKGEGWQTNTSYKVHSNPDAVKGGGIVLSFGNFPATMALYGKGSATELNALINSLMYESLLSLDENRENYIPRLATHWQISSDGKSYRFRINPDARFADGQPVTSEDVIATYDLCSDSTILFPEINEVAGMFKRPEAESKYIVKFTAKIDSTSKNSERLFSGWRYFLHAAGAFKVYPAFYIRNLSGKEYNEKYRTRYIPGSGPYLFDTADIVKESSFVLRRRSDYWAEKEKFAKGLYNFDFIKIESVNDEMLRNEKFKKGEIDAIFVFRAAEWVEKMTGEEYDRGIILKRAVYNKPTQGPAGICINMRRKPLDDIRIRKALSYAYNRIQFNTKLFHNSYSYLNSFFPGSIYENKNNPQTGFNLDSAKNLLNEAGWAEKNSAGFLIKNGKILEFDLPFLKSQERYFTIYKEDLAKIGIKLNLKETDAATLGKLGLERNFQLIPVAWLNPDFPSPDALFSSDAADIPNSNNWSGIKDKVIDSLIVIYNSSEDINKRVQAIKQIDSIAVNYYQYVLGWYIPYVRIGFQNKFGYPEGIIDKNNSVFGLLSMWYYDREKAENYMQAKDNHEMILEKGETENKYWLSH